VPRNQDEMATSQMSEVILHLRRAVLLRDGAGLTDGQLLEDYISRRDQAALAALVQRHGPMVWGVCRRVLHHHHDAEDAFQATFLVLVRKAASIVPRQMVANWLYGVAHQTALNARANVAKRKERERQVKEMPERAIEEQDLWRDLQSLLDQELSRLPDKYRVVMVLCDLEGKTRKQAARQLDVPEGTVAGRLARARAMLANRLSRHGIQLAGGALATALARNAASASVPISVVSSTIKSASMFAVGKTAAISVNVAAMAKGALKAMLLAKLKKVTLALLMLVVMGVGAGAGIQSVLGQNAPDGKKGDNASPQEAKEQKGAARSNEALLNRKVQEASWLLTNVDTAKNTISVTTPLPNHLGTFYVLERGRMRSQVQPGVSLSGLPVAKNAVIQLNGKNVKLSELKDEMRLSLQMSKDSLTIIGITATSPDTDAQYTVKAVDANNNTISVTIGRDGPVLEGLPVAKDAKIEAEYFDMNKARITEGRKLSDLQAGMPVRLEMGLDGGKLLVKAIQVGY
jgi:RNA polymerase sigma factor (sigma-70 family)